MLEPVAVRSEPSPDAVVDAMLDPRTPEGTQNLVLVRERGVGTDDGLWIRIEGPGLPGEAEGWVPRTVARPVPRRPHAPRRRPRGGTRRRCCAGDRVLARFPVGVGTAESPTPRGEFYVRNRLTRYANEFYGPLAFGTSAARRISRTGRTAVSSGIHGTNQPELLPGRVSHGCIRLRNDDILRLGRLMPVGTPITIR